MPLHDDTSEFCRQVCSEVKYRHAHEKIIKELSAHIEDSAEYLARIYPIGEEEARKEAIHRMGDPNQLGKQLNREHRACYDWIRTALRLLFWTAMILFLLYVFHTVRQSLQEEVEQKSAHLASAFLEMVFYVPAEKELSLDLGDRDTTVFPKILNGERKS